MNTSLHKIKFEPDQALVVNQDVSIENCLRKMRRRKVGSAIILSNTKPTEILGIFTERDFLQNIDKIKSGGFWEKSVTLVMKKPVLTIDAQDLDKAADILFVHHIRNLPIHSRDPQFGESVVGFLSMEKIYADILKSESISTKVEDPLLFLESYTPKQMDSEIILVENGVGYEFFHSFFSKNSHFKVKGVPVATLSPDICKTTRLIVFDIDRIEAKIWAGFLKSIFQSWNRNQPLPLIILLYNPILQSQGHIEIIKKLSESEKIAAFLKPIPILQVLRRIRDHFAQSILDCTDDKP